jgi:hypothetical protein
VFPRGWTLIRDGKEVGWCQTLTEAKRQAQMLHDGIVSAEHVFND